MSYSKELCPHCKCPFNDDDERKMLMAERVLANALDENDYAFFDLYREPPLFGDSWTAVGEFRGNITEADVVERAALIVNLIRDYGQRNKWTAEKIDATINRSANPMLEFGDPKLGRYIAL